MAQKPHAPPPAIRVDAPAGEEATPKPRRCKGKEESGERCLCVALEEGFCARHYGQVQVIISIQMCRSDDKWVACLCVDLKDGHCCKILLGSMYGSGLWNLVV